MLHKKAFIPEVEKGGNVAVFSLFVNFNYLLQRLNDSIGHQTNPGFFQFVSLTILNF